jgi:hypothetical protein
MKNKFLLIALLFIVGLFAYGEYSPSAKSIGHKIEQMKIGLENNFDCTIGSTNYHQIVWHHRLYFGLAEDSKHSVSNEEARAFLAANFPEFRFVDEFQLD